MTRALVALLLLAGCHRAPRGGERSPAPRAALADAAAPAPSPTPTLPPGPDAALAKGKLGSAPGSATLWPTRVCFTGNQLVFEHFCGCNDALLCTLAISGPHEISATLATDPDRLPHCLDCFPMEPGRCQLPPLGPGSWTVKLAGLPLLTLDPATPTCWE